MVEKREAIAGIVQDARLVERLDRLSGRGSSRAMTKAIRAGMAPIVKAMRRAVDSSPASRRVKVKAKRLVKQRFLRKARRFSQTTGAKVGFAVGSRRTQQKENRPAGAGVGLGARNIHWFVLGTRSRRHQSGHGTGSIRAVLGGVTKAAFAASAGASIKSAREKLWTEIQIESKKT